MQAARFRSASYIRSVITVELLKENFKTAKDADHNRGDWDACPLGAWGKKRRWCHWRGVTTGILVLLFSPAAFAGNPPRGITVDDLLSRTVIRSFSLSPDGSRVAFLTTKAIPRDDVYRVRLYLQETKSSSSRLIALAEYFLPPDEVFDSVGHFRSKTVSQYVWSPNSRRLLYTVHVTGGMELRIWDVLRAGGKTVLKAHQHIQMEDVFWPEQGLTLRTFDRQPDAKAAGVPDAALLMKDSYRFDLPLPNPRGSQPIASETWSYNWQAARATPVGNSRVVQHWPYPDEYFWTGSSLEIHYRESLPDQNLNAIEEGKSQSLHPTAVQLEMDYRPAETVVRISRGGRTRELYRDKALLIAHYSERTDQSRKTYLSENAHTAVLLRSTNLVPDQLVRIDLLTGTIIPLFSPNEKFRAQTRGISVRVMTTPVANGKLNGRLFLPSDKHSKPPYSLVFTSYLSTPGFNLGSGEVPILPLVTTGIAVFALDARDVNEPGKQGDFAPELRRLEQPLRAIEWIVEELSREGIIDPQRVGLTGLSYGTEIAMYAYWKSSLFRTVSATTGSWEPMLYPMGGVNWAKSLKDRGFSDPKVDLAAWHKLSAGMNARASLPPLLWQAPESERAMCIQSWFELRRAGAQVEWLEYPDEGHVKRHPANIWWVHQRNLDWFRFWLRDEEDSDPSKYQQYARWREMRRNWYMLKRDLQKPVSSIP